MAKYIVCWFVCGMAKIMVLRVKTGLVFEIFRSIRGLGGYCKSKSNMICQNKTNDYFLNLKLWSFVVIELEAKYYQCL